MKLYGSVSGDTETTPANSQKVNEPETTDNASDNKDTKPRPSAAPRPAARVQLYSLNVLLRALVFIPFIICAYLL